MEPKSLGIEPSRLCGPKKCPTLFYYLASLLVLIKHSDTFGLTFYRQLSLPYQTRLQSPSRVFLHLISRCRVSQKYVFPHA